MNIKSTIPKTDSAKEFMKFIMSQFESTDKLVARILMGMLTTMKFDDSHTIYEHVIDMINIATKLESMELKENESFLMTFIVNSLSHQYSSFQINYNTIKDK
ncbi:LOW QUALITY PROTEIN: hypothetical protein RJ641_000651 [Dillenia turbinata]|uniref:Uncharacterized protein n=1 Tax=Dillenia turbinata TaxID=194707 RepID=A0AAN8ZUD2_9MAGN